MDGITAFGMEVLGSLAPSILVLAKLQGRLQRVGAENGAPTFAVLASTEGAAS